MKALIFATAGALACSTPALAQDAFQDAAPVSSEGVLADPIDVATLPPAEVENAVLPLGTEVILRLNEEVTTSGNTWSEGDTFSLVVDQDVMLGQFTIIPEGASAQGRITSLSSRGAFGRSGKMDIELEFIRVDDMQIEVNGTYRQEGDGATLATLGGVLVAGPFAGFVTGESARIPNGRELSATLAHALEVDVPASSVEDAPAVSEIDSDWRTYYEFTDRSLSPSGRVMQARQMRDAAIEEAQIPSTGRVSIIGVVE